MVVKTHRWLPQLVAIQRHHRRHDRHIPAIISNDGLIIIIPSTAA
jgi:hypothetical protein